MIAEEHLGAWQKDVEIHDLNVGRLQPDGRSLTDDHWIYPGWVLVMPESAVGHSGGPRRDRSIAPRLPSPQAKPGHRHLHRLCPSRALENPHRVTPRTGPRSFQPPHPGPLTSRPAASIPNTSGRPARHQPRRDIGTPQGTKTMLQDSVVSLPAELVGAGVLWPPGSSPSSPNWPSWPTADAAGAGAPTHLRLKGRGSSSPARIGADFDTMDIVDLGCKFLAVQLSGSPPPPPIVAVEATEEWLAILLGETVKRAPDGFSVGPEGQSWILEQPRRLLQVADQLAEVVAPFPSLVSLGRTDDGITIFVNLGALGLVSIEGDPQMAAEAVTAAAIELATVPWSQQAEVILVGFGHAGGLGVAEPVTLVDTLEECLDRLQANSSGLQATADEAGAASLDELRLAGNPTDLDPSIVICLEQPDQAPWTSSRNWPLPPPPASARSWSQEPPAQAAGPSASTKLGASTSPNSTKPSPPNGFRSRSSTPSRSESPTRPTSTTAQPTRANPTGGPTPPTTYLPPKSWRIDETDLDDEDPEDGVVAESSLAADEYPPASSATGDPVPVSTHCAGPTHTYHPTDQPHP